jgi:hypothetical protein
MLSKIVKKLPHYSRCIPDKTGYEFVLFKKQEWIHKDAKLIQILRHREHRWTGWYINYGKRFGPKFQLFPFYFVNSKNETAFGVGLFNYFIGLIYEPPFTREPILTKKIYFLY